MRTVDLLEKSEGEPGREIVRLSPKCPPAARGLPLPGGTFWGHLMLFPPVKYRLYEYWSLGSIQTVICVLTYLSRICVSHRSVMSPARPYRNFSRSDSPI